MPNLVSRATFLRLLAAAGAKFVPATAIAPPEDPTGGSIAEAEAAAHWLRSLFGLPRRPQSRDLLRLVERLGWEVERDAGTCCTVMPTPAGGLCLCLPADLDPEQEARYLAGALGGNYHTARYGSVDYTGTPAQRAQRTAYCRAFVAALLQRDPKA